MADDEQRLRDAQREYLDFLDDEVCIRTNNTCAQYDAIYTLQFL